MDKALLPKGVTRTSLPMFLLWLLPWIALWPRLFGIKRLPLTLLGVASTALLALLAGPALGWGWTVLLCWLWFACPLAALPWVPSTIRMSIGPPIEPEALFGEDDSELDEAYERVESAVQGLVRDVKH